MTSSTETPGSAASLSRYWKLCAVLAPAVVFFALLWVTCTRSPILDDFDYLFPFAIPFEKTAGLGHKLLLLVTTQVGPYKAIYVYGIVELQLGLLGHLSFPLMVLIGNLTIAGIFAVIARNIMKTGPASRNVLLLLPVSLLLFTLNYAELMNWATAGLSPPSVVLFALVSLHFLVQRDRGIADILLAAAAGCLASVTVINGLVIWPVGLLFLLLQDRRAVRFAVWLTGAGLSVFVCFYHYQTSGLSATSSIVSKLLFFAMFCGGAIENMHHRPLPYISLAIGLFGIAVFVLACVKRFDRRSPFIFYSMLWVVLTGMMITVGRTSMGVPVSLSSRYKIYCDLLLIFSYAYLLDRSGQVEARVSTRRVWQVGVLAAAIIFLAGNVGGFRFLQKRKGQADHAMTEYLISGGALSPRYKQGDPPGANEYADAERARLLMEEAARLGIYRPSR